MQFTAVRLSSPAVNAALERCDNGLRDVVARMHASVLCQLARRRRLHGHSLQSSPYRSLANAYRYQPAGTRVLDGLHARVGRVGWLDGVEFNAPLDTV